ncbi:MAG: YiiX/YebB-like N1pC/P60 family cysteine hydrolase, partial [Hyphomicrobiales bacterium]
EPGDVLLIEGRQKLSTAVKYLTQSTWSHSALYVGDTLPQPEDGGERPCLIEVNLGEGCVTAPLSKYRFANSRICRPVGLSTQDRDAVIDFMVKRIGTAYDMKNIFDLARYLFPTPPVPSRLRRRMLALGSGDPTRAICSTMIAEAFQSVRYPILPVIISDCEHQPQCSGYSQGDILHIRHHSLFAPRDFDLSPYFAVIKPTVENGFNYRDLKWAEPADGDVPA